MCRPRTHLGHERGERSAGLLRQHRQSWAGEHFELADETTDPARMFRRELRGVFLRLWLERGTICLRERRGR
jgi:hypothetical protein